MDWLHDVSYLFGGAFLANAVPHFVSGMMGRPFQSPFAKPPGKGLSSVDRERALGVCELRHRLPADRPCGKVRSARGGSRHRRGRGRSADGCDGRAFVRAVSRRQCADGVVTQSPRRRAPR